MYAQVADKPYTIEYFQLNTRIINQDNGLSQGMVYGIAEDEEGYLWVATKDGLNRYNGLDFKVFRSESNNPNSISEGFITSLFIDSKNRLWIGTMSGGLNFFDKKNERFIRINEKFSEKDLNMDHIVLISELADNKLLIQTSSENPFVILEGLESTEDVDPTKLRFRTLNDLCENYEQLFKERIEPYYHHITADSSLWLYFNQEILKLSLKENNCEYSSYRVKDNKNYYIVNLGMLFTNIYNYHDDTSVYIAQDKKTIKKFNFKSNQFEHFLSLPDSFILRGKSYIDKSNNLCSFQTNGELMKYSLYNGEFKIFSIENKQHQEQIKSYGSLSAFIDKKENTWYASNGMGIFQTIDYSAFFMDVTSDSLTINNFRIQNIESNAYFDKKVQSIWNTLNINEYVISNKLNWINNFYIHKSIDKNNTIWIPFNDSMRRTTILYGFPKDGSEPIKIKTPNASEHIYSISMLFITKDNSLWFYTQSSTIIGNLYQLNLESLEIKEYLIPTTLKETEFPFISDFIVEKSGIIWLAAIDGLYRFNPDIDKWKYFSGTGNQSNKPATSRIFSILLDPISPDSFIWVGTDGEGLNKMNKNTGDCIRYSKDNGLANNVIYGILNDQRNNIWFSTNKGISLLNPSTNEIRNFGRLDGLPFLEFDRYKYSKDKFNHLYFSGQDRIIKVTPESFYHHRVPNKVIIHELKIFNHPVKYYPNGKEKGEFEFDFKLPSPITYCTELKFPYSAKMIGFSFTLLDLVATEDNVYQYKLEGFNDNWIIAGKEREAIYTNLDPGEYTFMVKGFNSADLWSESTTLKIRILSPWWRTWWFLSGSVLLFLVLVYIIYLNRLNQALRVEKMRNDIAQDLHDEIGSTLSSISLYSVVLQNTLKDMNPKAIQLLNNITNSTSAVMSSMNDMVWAIKSENDSFKKVINRIRAFAINTSESKNITLDFQVDTNSEALNMNMHQRKNIYLIFKEAINNAVKYSNAENLKINLRTNNKKLSLSLEDDGIGFDFSKEIDNDEIQGGNGLSGMYNRAKQIHSDLIINSENGKGTKIILTIPV